MPTPLTSSGYWLSAAGTAVLASLLSVLVARLLPRERFRLLGFEIVLAGGLFWGALATALVLSMWDSYYTFFAQDWQRLLAPLSAILYAGIALLLWWLTRRLPGPPALVFVVLGGLESLVEHSLAGAWIYSRGCRCWPGSSRRRCWSLHSSNTSYTGG